MGAPRKYLPHNSVIFVTFSLEQGLLLLSNPLCLAIIKSCLARAQCLFPVRISHFMVHANHVHLVLVVISPEHACKFIGHFKAESAHRFNQLFGWKKRTIWCEGYDSPVVLTPVRALIAIAYIYSNPAKDHQEESINKYPGLSSWRMFRSGLGTKQWKFIRRPAFRLLAKDAHSLAGYTRECARILKGTKALQTFRLEPDAWLEAFGISSEEEKKSWNDTMVTRVRTLEERYQRVRQRDKKRVVGRQALLRRSMTFDYQSKRGGKRMWCLSEDRKLRVKFIHFLKKLIAQAREVYTNWHVGDYSVAYPPGLFPPSQPRLFEPLEVW